jgi:hypothetical protein
MASLRHPSIVQFLAVCPFPPSVVTEYCSRGSLADVLRAAKQSPAMAAKLDWPRRLNMVRTNTGCQPWASHAAFPALRRCFAFALRRCFAFALTSYLPWLAGSRLWMGFCQFTQQAGVGLSSPGTACLLGTSRGLLPCEHGKSLEYPSD